MLYNMCMVLRALYSKLLLVALKVCCLTSEYVHCVLAVKITKESLKRCCCVFAELTYSVTNLIRHNKHTASD